MPETGPIPFPRVHLFCQYKATRVFYTAKLLLFFFLFLTFCSPLYGSETGGSGSYLAAGIGVEQLTYKEQIPDLGLASSETDLLNWVLYMEAQKAWKNFFIGAKGRIPLSADESREYWSRGGNLEQSNSLTYRWARADAHLGYFLHPLLKPYIGIHWAYYEQERSDFAIVGIPGIIAETATEEVYALSSLLGIQGGLPFAAGWSLSYSAEYMLPFYSNITNSRLPGWEASNINGYSYALAGRLHYAISETVSATLQATGGRQHWEGSDWVRIGSSNAKWPENDTDFISFSVSILKSF